MNAGDLTETIRIWSNDYTRSSDGEKIESPALYAKRRANVMAVAANERRIGQQLAADIDYIVTIRSDGITRAITPQHWITWGNRRLNIVRAYDPNARNEWVEIACKERLS